MITNKILIVDDKIENLRTIISIIEDHYPDCLLYQADNGITALKVINSVIPDIILSDWEMPQMDGIELLKSLKNNPATCHIPAIIVTGVMISSNDLKTAIDAGAVDFIRKPINPTELLARMNAAMKMASSHKKLVKEKENKIIENVILSNTINRFTTKFYSKVKDFENGLLENEILISEITNLFNEVENKVKRGTNEQHNDKFFTLYPDYKKRLLNIHPYLSPAELNLSAMIRLGLSIKELADMFFVSPESMRVSRSRLRKKLKLETNQNLQSYLLGF